MNDPKKKKAETKKPVAKEKLPETRSRARTMVFENKKPQEPTTNTKVEIQSIGNNKFKDLVSKFNGSGKGSELSNTIENKPNNTGKLDMARLSSFNSGSDSKTTDNKPVIGMSVKERMQMLLNNNKERSNTVKNLDPVLMSRMEGLNAEIEEDDDEKHSDDLSDDGLGLSDREDNEVNKNENIEENKNEEVKIDKEIKPKKKSSIDSNSLGLDDEIEVKVDNLNIKAEVKEEIPDPKNDDQVHEDANKIEDLNSLKKEDVSIKDDEDI